MPGITPLGRWSWFVRGWLLVGLLTGCDGSGLPSTPPARELVLSTWAEYFPQEVFDAFEREFGVKVRIVTYQSPEEAVERIRSGQADDVAVVDSDYLPVLVAEGRLAEIDFRRIPNIRNVSANFRDLATDPGHRHTVPFNYGTTGLLIRTDLIGQAVSRWTDLWEPRYAGRIGLRAQPRELIAFTLLSLGYGLNSEDPKELEAATQRLLALRNAVVLLPPEAESALPRLLSGELAILHGWPEDYAVAHASNPAVAFVYPDEGTALWTDNYVILAHSPYQETAMVLIDFLLRPLVAARVANYNRVATANEAALTFIMPEIRDDPVIFPPVELLRRSHFYMPLSPDGERRYAEAWARFTAGRP